MAMVISLTIGRVNEYLTMHHFRIPRHTHPMIKQNSDWAFFGISSEKLHCGNVVAGRIWFKTDKQVHTKRVQGASAVTHFVIQPENKRMGDPFSAYKIKYC